MRKKKDEQEAVHVVEDEQIDNEQIDKMNDLVRRIWVGQSPNLKLHVRKARIEKALTDKGFTDFDQIKWPEC